MEIIGSLSAPSKMPCFSFSISASLCNVGRVLREIAGSVCDTCYALRGRYLFANVKNAQAVRLQGLNHPRFVEAMSFVLTAKDAAYFRWFDAGDVQSVECLEKICQIARNCPNTKFWLPTKEYVGVKGQESFVSQWSKIYGAFPSNLTVRFSALMHEGKPPTAIAKRYGALTSTVNKEGYTCPAKAQGGKCETCRDCWDKSVANISYHRH